MNETAATLARVSQTEFDGKSLLGVPLMPFLRSLSLDQATTSATYEGYSVWAIVLHLLYHKYLTIELMGADPGLSVCPCEQADWPAVAGHQDAATWSRLLSELEVVHRAYLRALETFPAERWSEELPQWRCTIGDVLQCIAMHDVYHLAQMRNMGLRNLAK